MPHSNVYIRGVPMGFDTEDLRYLFEEFGTIVSAKILEPRHAGDKRLGFVKFADKSEARRAIDAMDKYFIAGQALEVREAEFDVDPKKNLLDKALVENDNLFVRGFPSYWSAEQLTEYFSQAGVVVSVRILNCSIPARGGVGLVRYTSLDDARRAVAQLNETSVDGFGPITVKYSTVKDAKYRRAPFRKSVMSTSLAFRGAPLLDATATTLNNDVYFQQENAAPSLPAAVLLCNLPPSTTELKIYQEFAPYGAIASVNIGLDVTQSCTGMAFVNFVSAAEAHHAAQTLNGTTFDGAVISAVAQT